MSALPKTRDIHGGRLHPRARCSRASHRDDGPLNWADEIRRAAWWPSAFFWRRPPTQPTAGWTGRCGPGLQFFGCSTRLHTTGIAGIEASTCPAHPGRSFTPRRRAPSSSRVSSRADRWCRSPTPVDCTPATNRSKRRCAPARCRGGCGPRHAGGRPPRLRRTGVSALGCDVGTCRQSRLRRPVGLGGDDADPTQAAGRLTDHARGCAWS